MNYIKIFGSTLGNRTKIVRDNIIGSAGLKIINIVISLIIVPLTIHYISADKYGIWLTLSSIIGWVTYFDFGLGHGFRNKFAETIAKGDIFLAKKFVATTYIVLGTIFFFVLIVVILVNHQIDWTSFLRINFDYKYELRTVFDILAICFCINCVVNTFNVMLIACQKTALASLFQTCGQIGGLVGIVIVTKYTTPCLVNLALVLSLIPCIVSFIISIIGFSFTHYKVFRPQIRYFDKFLIKNIIGLGGKFFIIMLSTLLIFQVINIVISRILGPLEVTQYNIAYKYFNVLHMGVVIVLTPLWSAFTDAYAKRDYKWMLKTLRTLERMGAVVIVLVFFMVLISGYVFKIWLGESVVIPYSVSILVGIYMCCMNFSAIYMYLINGIGKVYLQMIIYIFAALIVLPFMDYFGSRYGLFGILLVPIVVNITQAYMGRIQLYKLMTMKGKGIWNR